MTTFEPVSATLGGLLIGLAAGLLLLANGRIAGIAGILGGCFRGGRGELAWRSAFLLGLPLGAGLMGLARGTFPFEITSSPALLVAGGLLVGFGTQLGKGCTSGHGVCGLSRGSRRSLGATLTFMAVGAATVFVVRHALGGTP